MTKEKIMIDTHAHINHDLLKTKLDEIVCDLKNFEFLICPSYDKKTCETTLEFAKKYPKVFGALSIHPLELEDWNDSVKKFVENNLSHPKIVAVGEYGFDYHYQPFDKQKQREVFLMQLEIAKRSNLPSIFHVRDAFDDFFEALKSGQNGFCGGVVHCFDGSLKDAKTALDFGLMISFTGISTFKNRQDLREIIKYVPTDRIMLETDSPYLAPEPFRGKVCVPSYVQKVYELVSGLKNIKMEKLDEIISQNAKNFFKKVKIDEK